MGDLGQEEVLAVPLRIDEVRSPSFEGGICNGITLFIA